MTSPGRAELLEAVDVALRGDWESAHRIAQDREDDAIANWIHAVVHRMEGVLNPRGARAGGESRSEKPWGWGPTALKEDLGNARYWYQRCGRAFREEVSTEAELREIRAALLGSDQ